jgi:hypothetical protein
MFGWNRPQMPKIGCGGVILVFLIGMFFAMILAKGW